MATQSQFEELLSDIEPSPRTVGKISTAHMNLRNYLRLHPQYKDVHLYTFLTGSQGRQTALRPRMINGVLTKPDADIVVITNYTESDNPLEVLLELEGVLAEEYEIDQTDHTRSVGVKTTTVDMDVVPLIAPSWYLQQPFDPDINLDALVNWKLFIPDKSLAQWCETNPAKQLSWATELNKQTKCMFKPLVKLVKWWRRENPTAYKRPKGFVIECMIAECMDWYEKNYEEAFLRALEGIVSRYASDFAWGRVPVIPDPGVSTNSVTRSLTFEEFAAFYKKVKSTAESGRAAQKEADPIKQLEMWRKIFGERFPSAGRAEKGLLSPAAVTGGLSFPNHPVTPRKPGGFA